MAGVIFSRQSEDVSYYRYGVDRIVAKDADNLYVTAVRACS